MTNTDIQLIKIILKDIFINTIAKEATTDDNKPKVYIITYSKITSIQFAQLSQALMSDELSRPFHYDVIRSGLGLNVSVH